ncbi:MAG: LPS export ABC transporter permease LptF [Wenzhouxiangella sp.]
MLILQRYLLREGLVASVLSLLVFLGVILALFLAELLGDAAQGRLPAASILALLALRIPEAVLLIGPLALMIGLLLSFGRLAEQSEVVVMRAGGASFARCLAPVLLLASLWSAALFGVAGWLAPTAIDRTAGLLADAARFALVAGLQPGQFENLDHGRLTIYIGSVDRADGGLTDVFVRHSDPEFPEILTAARGRLWADPLDDSRYLSLHDGHQVRHPAKLGAGSLRDMHFARNDIRLPMPTMSSGVDGELVQTLPQLWPPQSPAAHREWHWRLAAPAAALVLGLLAIPLAHRLPRQGRWGSLVLALAIYLFYSNAIHAGLIVMEQRGTASGPGLWPLHGAIGLLGVVLMVRQWRRW